MKVTKLSYVEFIANKSKIIDTVRGWRAANRLSIIREQQMTLLCDWYYGVESMIDFLENKAPQITQSDFNNDEFTIFIVENDGVIQGICLGGMVKYKGTCHDFFGVHPGRYFEVSELLTSAPRMLSEHCDTDSNPARHKVSKRLLDAIIQYVSLSKQPHPITANVHHRNEMAHRLFSEYKFEMSVGAIKGYRYTLPSSNLRFHREEIAGQQINIIDEYRMG